MSDQTQDARGWGVTTADGASFPAFMGIELYPEGLTGTRGRLVASSAFEVDPVELEEFERQLPARAKHVTETQFDH